MQTAKETGHILTFYSFKGGVGRTMALANLAYYAAHSGKRVLIMDWDLEAPGLAYYFRGLLDPAEVRKLRERPGVLNLVWDWTSALHKVRSQDDMQELLSDLEHGTSFNNCANSIVDEEFIPEGAVIDYIGAGSMTINAPEPLSYEDALSKFSWSRFIERDGGGVWVEKLRQWAKRNYDLVLIDSRTGFADVAGMCTMQLPDEVALCFVLNRQNIDGIARISYAIRNKRSEEVKLRPIPMRVARTNTSEESDARAKAIADLTRIGGFAASTVTKDMSQLAIPLADNVPFYETLAPFTEDGPSAEVLPSSYKRMAATLLGCEIEDPQLTEELISRVRRRSQPRYATVDYIAKLNSAEPSRAISELARLAETALESELEGSQVDDDYVHALLNASFSIDSQEYPSELLELQSVTLDLLRTVCSSRPAPWRMRLVSAIERHVALMRLVGFDDDAELALLEELDALLAESPTVAARLQRINHRRRVGWLYFSENDIEAASQVNGEVWSLTRELLRDGESLSPEQLDELITAQVDAGLLRGDISKYNEQEEAARDEYLKSLDLAIQQDNELSRSDLKRLRSDLHVRLALLPWDGDSEQAATHAVEAAKLGSSSFGFVYRFHALLSVVLNARNSILLEEFCVAAFSSSERSSRSVIANYYGRQARLTIQLLDTLVTVANELQGTSNKIPHEIVISIGQLLEAVLRIQARRRSVNNERIQSDLREVATRLLASLIAVGISEELYNTIQEAITLFPPGSGRRNKGLLGRGDN